MTGASFFLKASISGFFNRQRGLDVRFVQDNHSRSIKSVPRGLHYQIQHPQGKLVRITEGAVFDVAVDLRRSSPNYAKRVDVDLSGDNKRQLWISLGFAHGFVVTSDSAEFLYKSTDHWYPEHERSLLWNDPNVGISGQLMSNRSLQQKMPLRNAWQRLTCLSEFEIKESQFMCSNS